MRGVVAHDGGFEVRTVDAPTPRPGEVLIQVHAAGLNAADRMIARGSHVTGMSVSAPGARLPSGIPMGGEASGVVTAVGAGVTAVRVGDRVMAMCRGAFADFAVADVGRVLLVPDSLSLVEAAGVPVTFVTAHNALREGRLAVGTSVLVNAASSGVGVAALQLAKALGAGTVIASSTSAATLDKLAAAGIPFDLGVVAGAGDFRDRCSEATGGVGVELVIDNVGGPAVADNVAVAALGGRVVSVGRIGGTHATINLDEVARKRISLIGVTFRTRSADETNAVFASAAADVLPALAAGRVRVLIDRTFPLDEVAAAEAYLEQGRHIGKVVLTTGA